MLRVPARTVLFFAVISVTIIVVSLLQIWSTTDGSSSMGDLKSQLSSYVKGNEKPVRVVASMSTFGKRIDRIEQTVESLYKQTWRPEVLYLHVPKEVKRIQVDDVMRPLVKVLEKKYKGWLKVTRPDDYGPSTKLLGTLLVEKDPNTIIVTIDDDQIYHHGMINALAEAAQAHPDAAPCFICETWPKGAERPFYAKPGECFGWGNAFAGLAYRVRFFDEGVFDYSTVPKGCYLHDDVYLSGFLRGKGHRPYVIDPGFGPITQGMSHTNLSINSVKNTESDYRDPCVRHFDFFDAKQ
ncbi:hypothetical protein HDU97_002366 [Phlyctochytrium planicorne]|nr:hypothetical protein HDU97_002366 [Phlyctochytrium planicorne]